MMKKLLYTCVLLLTASGLWAQANPCEGGVVGRQAGRTDWGPFECTTVTVSQDRYEEMRLAEEQLKEVRTQVVDVYRLTRENLQLRDSLILAERQYRMEMDRLREETATLNRQNEQLANDALRNAEYCEQRLTLAKARSWLFGIGGAVGGAVVGMLVGKTLAN